MIGDIVTLDGAQFPVQHVIGVDGLVHAVLKVNSDRFHTPVHASLGGAVVTDAPVLTCFACINHVWRSTPERDRFSDVDEDGSSYEDDDD